MGAGSKWLGRNDGTGLPQNVRAKARQANDLLEPGIGIANEDRDVVVLVRRSVAARA